MINLVNILPIKNEIVRGKLRKIVSIPFYLNSLILIFTGVLISIIYCNGNISDLVGVNVVFTFLISTLAFNFQEKEIGNYKRIFHKEYTSLYVKSEVLLWSLIVGFPLIFFTFLSIYLDQKNVNEYLILCGVVLLTSIYQLLAISYSKVKYPRNPIFKIFYLLIIAIPPIFIIEYLRQRRQEK